MFLPRLVWQVRQAIGWRTGEAVPLTPWAEALALDLLSIVGTGSPAPPGLRVASHRRRALPRPVPADGGPVNQRVLQAFLAAALDAHRENAVANGRLPDAVDRVLLARGVDGRALSPRDMVAALAAPLVDGAMDLAHAIAQCLVDLLRAPDVLASVLLELRGAFAEGEPPAVDALRRLRWLRAAYRESLRLHPPLPVAPRMGARALARGGSDPDLEPREYDPSRYLEPRFQHEQPGASTLLGPAAALSAGFMETLALLAIGCTLATWRIALASDARANPSRATAMLKVEGPRVWRPSRSKPVPIEDYVALALPTLDRATVAGIAGRLRRERFEPGATVIRQGEPAETLYLLVRGAVDVLREHPDGRRSRVAELGVGDYFGEMGLLHGVGRNASVLARGEVEVLAMDRATFEEVIATSDLTSAEINRLVRRRLMATTLASALPALAENAAPLAARFALRAYRPGEIIIREGDPANRFYVVARGAVDVLRGSGTGSQHTLARIEAGEYFGEIGLLHNTARTATVRAVAEDDVLIMELDRQQFAELIASSSDAGEDIAETVYLRLLALVQPRAEKELGAHLTAGVGSP